MSRFKNMSPVRAIRDLRSFLTTRKPYELWFMALALLLTAAIWVMFLKDSQFEKPYKPNIIYVENWPITRSDAEIVARLKADKIRDDARNAELLKKQRARQQEFKKIDDGLKSIGL